MKKILITGGSGLLALNWAVAIRDQAEVHLGLHSRKVALNGTLSKQIDIDSLAGALRSMEALQPDLVVHAAGLTSVETCEADSESAFQKNVTLTKNIAQACDKLCIKLIHISTDHLFEGSQTFRDESATPRPRNTYAQSKVEAESCVLQINPGCLVIRTNFYGWGTPYRKSFSDQIIESLRKRISLKLFQDIFYTPILTESLALAAMELARMNVSGIVNLAGDRRISKFDFGIMLANEFRLDAGLISPIKFNSRPDLVPRPLDMSLDTTKAIGLLGRKPSSLQSDLRRLRQQDKQGLAKEFSVL